MQKTVVFEFFGGGAAAARALGVTKSAAHQWKSIIPEAMAYRAQEASGGKLVVDPSVYRKDLCPDGITSHA